MCGPPAKLGVNYIPANSEDGRSNFVNGLNDFAVTATPFTDDQKKALDKAGRTFQYAPLTTSGLVLAYKVFDQDAAHAEPGAQVTDLKLTPALAARIFTGQLTNWHVDPEINALNPGHVFPPSVRALVRGDHSSANLEFTSWLSAAGGSALPTDWPGPGEDYPLKYLVQDSGIVGGDKLADAIADPKTASLNTDYFNAGYIGFIDSSQASYYGLPTAKIENAAGQFVTATPQSIYRRVVACDDERGRRHGQPELRGHRPRRLPDADGHLRDGADQQGVRGPGDHASELPDLCRR